MILFGVNLPLRELFYLFVFFSLAGAIIAILIRAYKSILLKIYEEYYEQADKEEKPRKKIKVR